LFTDKSKGERGAASVYLMLVIVPIFVFMTVLADFARIGAADRETELAVKAGLRSAMSAFDSELQKYGLYGLALSAEERDELYKKALAANVANAGSGFFPFVDTRVTPGSERLQSVVTLGYPDVFRRQTMEEMKYRAPLEYMLEVTDKLKATGVSSRLSGGKAYAEDTDKLESLIDKREDALDDVWTQFRMFRDNLNGDHDAYRSRLEELNSLADQIGLNTLDNVRQALEEIDNQIRSLEQSLQELDGSLAALARAAEQSQEAVQAIAEARENVSGQLQELLAKKNDLEHLLQLLLQYAALIASTQAEVKASAAAVTDAQSALNEALNEAKQANDALRTEWNRVNAAEANGVPAAEPFGDVRVLPDEYFAELQADAGAVTALFQAFAGEVEETLSYTDNRTAALNAGNDAYAAKVNAAYASREAAERQRQERNDTVKMKKRQLWSDIGGVLDQAKQAIGGCRLGTEGDRDRLSYEKLGAAEAKYTGVGEAPDAGEAVVGLNDAKRISIDALRLGGIVAAALTGIRDSVFLNEYALTHFNYRTYGLERDGNGQAKPVTTLAEPEHHTLGEQEAEYVAYGFSSCAANIGSAYGEMFAIRLSIRTLERLSDPQNELLQLGSPLLVLLAAAAEGAAEALQDMYKLTGGEEVPLSSKLAPAVTFNYKDYLRLLMLIHGSSERKLSRLQALVELNTGVDLTQAAAAMRAEAETSVRLWFIPGGMKLLGLAGMSPCQVLEGRCRLKRSAEWGY
jgi:exonuclease VII small subunit